MIGEKGKFAGFKGKSEMVNGGVSCKEFMIKGGVLGLPEDNFLEKNARGDQDPCRHCCRTAPT